MGNELIALLRTPQEPLHVTSSALKPRPAVLKLIEKLLQQVSSGFHTFKLFKRRKKQETRNKKQETRNKKQETRKNY